jgi:wobble nucleotide-excising tRNase
MMNDATINVLSDEVKIKNATPVELIQGVRELVEEDFTTWLGHEDGAETLEQALYELEARVRKLERKVARQRRQIDLLT